MPYMKVTELTSVMPVAVPEYSQALWQWQHQTNSQALWQWQHQKNSQVLWQWQHQKNSQVLWHWQYQSIHRRYDSDNTRRIHRCYDSDSTRVFTGAMTGAPGPSGAETDASSGGSGELLLQTRNNMRTLRPSQKYLDSTAKRALQNRQRKCSLSPLFTWLLPWH